VDWLGLERAGFDEDHFIIGDGEDNGVSPIALGGSNMSPKIAI
jgi:hypothetical protein